MHQIRLTQRWELIIHQLKNVKTLDVGQIIPLPFVSPLNFLDPKLYKDEDGVERPYGPYRYRQLVNDRYYITKHTHISYTDTGLMTPTERRMIIEFINKDIAAQNEAIQKSMKKR